MHLYDWNYFTTLINGVPYTRVFILCSPGDWPEIRDSLAAAQPWDESAHGDPQVHDAACWTVRRLGVHVGALSPPYGPGVDLTAQALDTRALLLGRNTALPTGVTVLNPDELG